MKRFICSVLAILMCLSLLSVGASASFKASASAQNLEVNGTAVTCEKYNIDGSNYFKLRDIAKLLSGTKSQFEVGWDNASQTISITTGSAYTAVGGELEVRGDLSKQTKVSNQALLIDGAKVSSLSVYNIGGNNFFKLRDLGDALGFTVDFDAASNTAIVESADTLSAVSMNEAYGLPKHFTPYAKPKNNQEHIQNLIYAFINGNWAFSETLPDGCEWIYPSCKALCKENNEVFGIFANQKIVPYCKGGNYGFATYGAKMPLTAKEITSQVQTAYAKAAEISQNMRESKKITEKSTQAEIAKVYYDYLLKYGVSVGGGNTDPAKALLYDSAYSVLIGKKADCGGRAAATSLLLRMERIPSTCIFVGTYINGKYDAGHVFTYAILDGKKQGVDWGNKIGIFDYSSGKVSGGKATFIAESNDFSYAEAALGIVEKSKFDPILLRWQEIKRDEKAITYRVWLDGNSAVDTQALYYLWYGMENNCITGDPMPWGARFSNGALERTVSIATIQKNNIPECFSLIPADGFTPK